MYPHLKRVPYAPPAGQHARARCWLELGDRAGWMERPLLSASLPRALHKGSSGGDPQETCASVEVSRAPEDTQLRAIRDFGDGLHLHALLIHAAASVRP